MKPYTLYMERRSHIDANDAATFARRIPANVDRALGDTLGTFVTAGVTFFSAFGMAGAASLLFHEPVPVVTCAQVAAGVTGLGMLVRGAIGSPRVLLLIELLTESGTKVSDNGLSPNETPRKQPGALPSSNYAQQMFDDAVRIWEYTCDQYQGAAMDNLTLDVKPWSRRAGHGIKPDPWVIALNPWIAGGLIKSRKATKIDKVDDTDYRGGLVYIKEGMRNLGYMLLNGAWSPK